MRLHRRILLTSAPRRNTDPAIPPLSVPIVPSVLDAPRHRLFAPRLAVLIERIRVANREGLAEER